MAFGSSYILSMHKGKKSYLFQLFVRQLGYPLYVGDRVRAFNVMKHLDPSDRDMILDAGCGIGVYSVECCLKGANVIGIDISKKNVDYALRATKAIGLNKKASFIVADVCNMPIRSDVFNKIICVDVLEHVKKDFDSIRELSRVLKNLRGFLVLHVPQVGTRTVLIKEPDYRSFGHVREGYTIKIIKAYIEELGLTITHFEDTFKTPAGLAWEINYCLKKSILALLLFPMLLAFSRIDFLSRGKGRGLLVIAKSVRASS